MEFITFFAVDEFDDHDVKIKTFIPIQNIKVIWKSGKYYHIEAGKDVYTATDIKFEKASEIDWNPKKRGRKPKGFDEKSSDTIRR